MDSQWYKDAVIYELYLPSFSDGNGDGTGDLPGLLVKLDYLQGLGAAALLLRGFDPSPRRTNGHATAGFSASTAFAQELA